MKYFLLFLILFFSQLAMTQTINLQELEGKWHINMTNFPMWLKGDKTQPTFNYTIEKRGEIVGLRDEVQYLKKGKTKSILGFDKPTNEQNTTFIWRGKGLMKLLKSEWKIIYLDSENEVAIIFFEKTLFTPAGYDVISRKQKLDDKVLSVVKATLLSQEIKVELAVL